MHSFSSTVEQHYTQGNIYEAIISFLNNAGITTGNITRKHLAGIDEFHIRGQELTRELALEAALQPGMRILDVGCGLGGPCRFFADEFKCIATGIDITKEYVEAAARLSALTGLQQGTDFVHGSATDLPFPGDSFDLVWTQHAQMNIAGKKKMYDEIFRVLVPGGKFVYYDIFGIGDKSLYFPLPWAGDASISYLISPGELKTMLDDTGFKNLKTTDQTNKSIEALQKIVDQNNLPPAGSQLVMGSNAMEKLKNLLRNLSEKKIVVESGIAIKDSHR